MSDEHSFSVSIELLKDFQFKIDFAEFGELLTDEPAPLGAGNGPNPMRLLAASVANCLAASLLFAIRKFKGDPGKITGRVYGSLERVNERWRARKLQVELKLANNTGDLPRIERVLQQFEDFCIVTQSVRDGIEVEVTVLDNQGNKIYAD